MLGMVVLVLECVPKRVAVNVTFSVTENESNCSDVIVISCVSFVTA